MNTTSVLQFIAQRQKGKEASNRTLAQQHKISLPPTTLQRQSEQVPGRCQDFKGGLKPAVETPKALSSSFQSYQADSGHQGTFDTDAEDFDDTIGLSNKSLDLDQGHPQKRFRTLTYSNEFDQDFNRRDSLSSFANQNSNLDDVNDDTQSDDDQGSSDVNDINIGINGAGTNRLPNATLDTSTNRFPNATLNTGPGPPPSENSSFEQHRTKLSSSSSTSSAQQGEAVAERSSDHHQPFSIGMVEHYTKGRSNSLRRGLSLHPEKHDHLVSAVTFNGPGIDKCKTKQRGHEDRCTMERESSKLSPFPISEPKIMSLTHTNDSQLLQNHERLKHHHNQIDINTDSEQSNVKDLCRPIFTDTQHKKRPRDLDYSNSQLKLMNYQKLRDESFDHDPSMMVQQSNAMVGSGSLQDKLNHIFSHQQDKSQGDICKQFFASLSIDEYEVCGDFMIDRFSAIILKFKQIRQQKRIAAYNFELEIECRQKFVSSFRKSLDEALSCMQRKGKDIVPKSSKHIT